MIKFVKHLFFYSSYHIFNCFLHLHNEGNIKNCIKVVCSPEHTIFQHLGKYYHVSLYTNLHWQSSSVNTNSIVICVIDFTDSSLLVLLCQLLLFFNTRHQQCSFLNTRTRFIITVIIKLLKLFC